MCGTGARQVLHGLAAAIVSTPSSTPPHSVLPACGCEPQKALHASGVAFHAGLQGLKLASATLPAPVSKISFHPADNSVLLTSTAQSSPSLDLGADHTDAEQAAARVLLWQLHKLWERHELQPTPLQLPSSLGCDSWPTCHAWAPEVGAVAALLA